MLQYLAQKLKKPAQSLFAMTLFIGDSHTYQSFGRQLDQLLRSRPEARVATFAGWGSSPGAWLSGGAQGSTYYERDPDGKVVDLPNASPPKYSDLLDQHQPDFAIVALGANLYGAPLEYAESTVRRLAVLAATAKRGCLWVGPPDSRDRAGDKMKSLYKILRQAASPYCQFVDSRKWTKYPSTGGDGVHYDYLGEQGLEQTKRWAQQVFQITLEKP